MAIHLNVRSLSQHFEDLCNLLDSSAFVFDVIGCSETWFTTHTDANVFQIPGYNLISNNCVHSIGGGVALLVKSNKNFCVRDDLKIDQIENIWVETQDITTEDFNINTLKKNLRKDYINIIQSEGVNP